MNRSKQRKQRPFRERRRAAERSPSPGGEGRGQGEQNFRTQSLRLSPVKVLDRLRSLRFLLLKLVNIRAIPVFPVSFIRVHTRSSVVKVPALPRLLISCSIGLLPGCSRAPTFDIVGSFFPAWLVCLILGIVLTSFSHWLRLRLKVPLVFPILVYPCLAALFTFVLWLIFFS